MKRMAVYARLSAMPPDEVSDSVPQQVRGGLACVARTEGWTLVPAADDLGPDHVLDGAVVDRAISAWDGGPGGRGRVKDRPGWSALLAMRERGEIDGVVTRHVDRLMRNPQARADCRRVGLEIADHSGHVIDDFALGILSEVATKESDVRSERQLLAEDRRVRDGRPPRGGRRHFGYHGGNPDHCCGDPDACLRWAIRDDEAEVVRELAERYLRGEPLRRLARELDERGVPTVLSGEWRNTGLRKLLLSPVLAGVRVHRRDGETTYVDIKNAANRGEPPRDFVPIIDRHLHARLVEAAKRKATRTPPERYLLTGLIRCARCDERPLNGKQHSATQRRYHCRGCMRNGIAARPVDDAVTHAAITRTWERLDSYGDELRTRLADAEERRRSREAKRDEWDDLFSSGEVRREQYTRSVAKLSEEIDGLRDEEERLRDEIPRAEGRWTILRRKADAWDDPTERRRLLDVAVDKIVLAPVDKRGGRLDLSRLRVHWADGEVTGVEAAPEPRVWEPSSAEDAAELLSR